MAGLDRLIRQADFTIIAAAIDKRGLEQPHDLYEIALRNCMERTYGFLENSGERKRTTHIIIEGRGSKEDRQLTEAFSAFGMAKTRQAKLCRVLILYLRTRKPTRQGYKLQI